MYHVSCITIIDTIILHIYTNDAYYNMTPTCHDVLEVVRMYHNNRHNYTQLYTIILHIYTNDAYLPATMSSRLYALIFVLSTCT
jgi:hypothetical protein